MILERMSETGSLKYTFERLQRMQDELEGLLKELEGLTRRRNKILEGLLERLKLK